MTETCSTKSQQPVDSKPTGWLVSPAFDLLFLANIAWPLLLWPGLLRSDGQLQTEFWQIHFLTTPHRWITLFLVAFDPDRREGRHRFFIGLAIFAAAGVAGVWMLTGALTCLLLVDYLWNAWHFASQHHGVLRMYSRKAGAGPEWLERHGLRLFLTYTLFRTAGWATGWLEADTALKETLHTIDLVLLGIPGALLLVNLINLKRERIGKLCYLVSLVLLYAGLLLSLRNGWRSGVFALTAASSTFHAVEYLAVVSHYAARRSTVGSAGLFRRMSLHWVGLLAIYILVLGLVGIWATTPSTGVGSAWAALNVWAAFLHYTYDGLIWKLRKPATAQALGVSS